MRLLLAIVIAGLAGCVTPSIPIPPPDPSAMEFTVSRDDNGDINTASLYYPPTQNYCGGVAYVFNRQLGTGIIETVKASCAIGPTTPVAARADDELVISVENDEQTVSTCIVLTASGTAAGVCQ
jgi:hypothetical protein